MSCIASMKDFALNLPDGESCGNFEDTIKGCKVYTIQIDAKEGFYPELQPNGKIMNIAKSRRKGRTVTFENKKGFSISVQFETVEQSKLIKKEAKSIAFQ